MFPPGLRLGHRVILEARKYGIVIRPLGDVIVLMPPLTIPRKALKELVTGTYHAVRSITESQ
jgi:adenosylmethionine-8-amino-7-oxononanoate aminotransferase